MLMQEPTEEMIKEWKNIFVEGSSYLFDELTTFTGLDEYDIKNYFLVAQYIKCKEKFKV